MTEKFPLAVVGGGLVGLTAVLRLADAYRGQSGKIAFIAPLDASTDGRTTAILMPGVEMFRSLSIWEDISKYTAPLKTMRLIDGSNRLIRAPVSDFKASELDLDAFGYNVPNAKMSELLEVAIAKHPAIERFDTKLASAECSQQGVSLSLENNTTVATDYAVAADGRNSIFRQAAGIETRQWSYPQTAVVLNFSHTQPHGNISTEFHTETGPFTHVPLPPNKKSRQRSSLVWVVEPPEAEWLIERPLEELSRKIETKMQSSLGKITVEGRPQSFPLVGMTAKCLAVGRVALVGEAAHVIPPIGAQGFNLGLRDIEGLVELVKKHTDFDSLSRIYNNNRKLDINIRTAGIDLMNRSLLTSFLPVQALRVGGMTALQNIPLLRNWAMHIGVGGRSYLSAPPFSKNIREKYRQAARRSQ